MTELSFTVTTGDAGIRLDKWLSAQQGSPSRNYLQQLMTDGHLRRNDQPVTNPAAKVKSGECYRLVIPDVKPLALEPVPMPLDIRYEDASLLVINKPAGLTVHPAAGTREPTLVHGLIAHCGESLSGIGGVARPGIVHRLDKDTSGLIIIAKHDAAHQHLSAQLKDRSLSRIYQAVVWGSIAPAEGTVDAPIARHPKDRKRMAVVAGGKSARTHYRSIGDIRVTGRNGAVTTIASHIECKLETGRTHQIRVHLNHLGHGLIGDPVYGPPTAERLIKLSIDDAEETKQFLIGFNRQALHAQTIRFNHPDSNEIITISCPLPTDMEQLLQRLYGLPNRLKSTT